MKSFLWSSKNKKSSTSKSQSNPQRKSSGSLSSLTNRSSSSLTESPESINGLSQYLQSNNNTSSVSSDRRRQVSSKYGAKSTGHLPADLTKRQSSLSSRDHQTSNTSRHSLNVYNSDVHSRSTRSVTSTMKDDTESTLSDDIRSTVSQHEDFSDDRIEDTGPNNQTFPPLNSRQLQQQHQPPINQDLQPLSEQARKGSISRVLVHLNDDNYDTTIFKVNWVNRSHGQILSTEPSQQPHNNSSQQLRDRKQSHRESMFFGSDMINSLNEEHANKGRDPTTRVDLPTSRSSMLLDTQIMVPDYKIYRAELKGCILNLYKSGLNSNIKYFDPNLPLDITNEIQNPTPRDNESIQSRQSLQPEALLNKRATISNSRYTLSSMSSKVDNQTLSEHVDPKAVVPVELKYLSEVYPHPNLKLDKDGMIIGGDVESLCHAILFSNFSTCKDNSKETSKKQRNIFNLLLALPLVDYFIKFLTVFNQYGLTFTKHKSQLTSTASQYYKISYETDEQMTERLALVVRTILDVLPGFLLDDQMLQATISLLSTISLHNDEISNNLKILVAAKHNELSLLTASIRPNTDSTKTNVADNTQNEQILKDILNFNKFLKLDINEVANEIHKINLKFDKVWAPRVDYSLLYSSKYTNDNILILNPLVFNNKENLHFLGRLLVCHLFPSDSTRITSKQRAKILIRWVELGCKFEKLGDMVSWLAIATVICSVPVLRIFSSWQHVPEPTLKIIFKDWVPTIVQLDRRQTSSKSTSSVFILAPPNLNDPFIRGNVISYFGDLIMHADDLPNDVKFKYLEKKINRTKNAFHKWEQRLQTVKANDSTKENKTSTDNGDDESSNAIYQFWKYHISQPALNIEEIMKLSLLHEEPVVDPKLYSEINSRRSPLLTGSYLPILFNELFPNYSLFPKSSLIGAADSPGGMVPPSRSSARLSRSISVREPAGPLLGSALTLKNLSTPEINQVTGIGNIDDPTVKELMLKQSKKQILMKSIRDVFNIDTDLFHVADDVVFKSAETETIISRPASMVLESPRRFSQQSFSNTNSTRDSRDANRLSRTLENLSFFDNIGSSSDTFKESVIHIVLKAATLEKFFDILVLTANVFSKLIDTKDLEAFYCRKRGATSTTTEESENEKFGLLDYAFVKLVLDNDTFTKTFFNSYKSFTTTIVVLENLAKRYIGAKSCAVTITKMLNSNKDSSPTSLNDHQFPVWDVKVPRGTPLNTLYLGKIQVGAAEAILHLVINHYSDFTDNLKCNSTLLDILKVMEQEVTLEWPSRIKEIKFEGTSTKEYIEEVESVVDKLVRLFHDIKSNYQKQLYRPVGISRLQRKITESLESFKSLTFEELQSLLNSKHLDDTILSNFHHLKHNKYEDMLDWTYQMNNLILEKMNLVTEKEWFLVYQILDLESSKSFTSFFSYPLNILSSNLVNSASAQSKELEILNFFTWISTLVSTDATNKEAIRIIDMLPNSIQILIKQHCSLTAFFKVEISNTKKNVNTRTETCAVLLQILNYARWKNASLDLFESINVDDPHTISPHVPSFIETAISNAIVSPESRIFEFTWKAAHDMLSANSVKDKSPSFRFISDVLDTMDDIHLKKFLEIDNVFDSKLSLLAPCPGWFICRLLDISQFVPNMSITNSKLINFDKRRFINNIISNILDLLPKSNTKMSSHAGYILMNTFNDPSKLFRKAAREVAIAEARTHNYQEIGMFNNILQAEIDKVRREQKKLDSLRVLEHESKQATHLQQDIYRQKNKNSLLVSNLHSNQFSRTTDTTPSNVSISSSNNASRNKRNSAVSIPHRGSIGSVNATPSTGVGKKLGGFFRRPFSIAGFNTSISNYSLNSSLQDPQSRKVIQSSLLPDLSGHVINDSKPVLSIKTFDIKNIVEIMNHRNIPAYSNSFKIIMQDGHEYTIQGVNSADLHDWIKMIKASKRYSFHSKKYKGKTFNKVFGVPLEDICAKEGTIVPTIVVKLLEEIELRGLDEVGLYRIPGSVGSINSLKNAFDEEGAVNNTFTLEDDRWFEINAIAGCFKMYLRELPDSLLSNEKVGDFTKLAMSYKTNEIGPGVYQSRMITLLKQLPVCYYQTMKRIVLHLNRVHQHVTNNRMDASNLAIVFSMSFIDQDDLASSMGPILGAVQSILQDFIRNPGDFFVEKSK